VQFLKCSPIGFKKDCLLKLVESRDVIRGVRGTSVGEQAAAICESFLFQVHFQKSANSIKEQNTLPQKVKVLVNELFYVRNLQMLVLSHNICPWQAMPAMFEVMDLLAKH
jgi:hypothetical protein